MIHAPHTLRETCHCGHHKDTHHESSGSCLGMRCDDCPAYRDDTQPDPLTKIPTRPKHAAKWNYRNGGSWDECQCYYCKKYDEYLASLEPDPVELPEPQASTSDDDLAALAPFAWPVWTPPTLPSIPSLPPLYPPPTP